MGAGDRSRFVLAADAGGTPAARRHGAPRGCGFETANHGEMLLQISQKKTSQIHKKIHQGASNNGRLFPYLKRHKTFFRCHMAGSQFRIEIVFSCGRYDGSTKAEQDRCREMLSRLQLPMIIDFVPTDIGRDIEPTIQPNGVSWVAKAVR